MISSETITDWLPSLTPSLCPVRVTVCGLDQFPEVNVSCVVSTVISVVSRLATSITTSPSMGMVFSTTSKVAEVPVSEVTRPLEGVTETPGASSSRLVTSTLGGVSVS